MGFISSVTQPFCRGCNRLRLSAEGKLFTCLFSASGFDVRELLRSGKESRLRLVLEGIWQGRTDRYSEERGSKKQRKVEMSYLGG